MKRRRHPRSLSALFVVVAASIFATGCADDTAPRPAGESPSRPNVLVILVDTLRADALGFAGYERDTSPRLDRWVERGVVFDGATTPAGWTRPAVVSLFTGLYPATHGTQDKEHVAPDSLVTLAEVFQGAGYATDAFVTNFAVHSQFGTGQGFEKFRWFDKKVDSSPTVPVELNYVPAGDIDREIRAHLEKDHERPFFTYVHTTDPHYPYIPPPEYRLFGADQRALYDGEVRYSDDVIGGWLDLLEETGRLRDTIVVLTADHGEEFEEHGHTGHGVTVFEEIVRVPLVVWAPGLGPGRRASQVSLADLASTLVEAAGIEPPERFAPQSRSFWSIAGTGDPVEGWASAYHELVYRTKGIAFGYRADDEKIVYIVGDKFGREEFTGFYDLAHDPFEQQNLANSATARTEEMVQAMAEVRKGHLQDAVDSVDRPLDEDAIERLRDLGYID